jgi:aspartate racemase
MSESLTPRAGLVGGIGPESTVDYYRRILEGWEKRRPGSSPSIIIDSLDVQHALRLVARDRAAFTDYLAESLNRLERAGATFIAMTANTAHLVFDELTSRMQLPMISIVETCADEAQRRGMRKLALLGTRFTMEAPFYAEVFARKGMTVISPEPDDRVWVHERYVGQLLKGDFRDETRAEIIALVERLHAGHEIDGVILGGTELPLLLRSERVAGLPTLDTTALHVEAIVDRLAQ